MIKEMMLKRDVLKVITSYQWLVYVCGFPGFQYALQTILMLFASSTIVDPYAKPEPAGNVILDVVSSIRVHLAHQYWIKECDIRCRE